MEKITYLTSLMPGKKWATIEEKDGIVDFCDPKGNLQYRVPANMISLVRTEIQYEYWAYIVAMFCFFVAFHVVVFGLYITRFRFNTFTISLCVLAVIMIGLGINLLWYAKQCILCVNGTDHFRFLGPDIKKAEKARKELMNIRSVNNYNYTYRIK